MAASANPFIAEWRSHWTLPIAAAIGYAISVLHLYAIGPFIEPLQQAFGWSRAQLSIGITIVGLTGATLSVPVGMLVDRVGPRPICLTGVVLMTSAFALLGTATGSPANWIVLWSLVAFANLGLQATVLTSAVATRFEASRGLAFAVTMSGGSLGTAILPVLAAWLIASFGWRNAFVAIGAIWAAIGLPFMLLFFRGAQDGARARREARNVATLLPGVSLADGLRSPSFYKLLMASGLLAFTNVGIIVHFVPILQDAGADAVAAARTASLIGISSIVGRLGAGLLLDRFPGHIVGASVFCLPIIACALLVLDEANPLSQAAAAAAFGLTVGAEVDVIAYLVSRHFGLKHFGVFFGVIISALTLGVAFGPLAAGAAFDWYGSYERFIVLTMVAMAASSIALMSLPQAQFIALNTSVNRSDNHENRRHLSTN